MNSYDRQLEATKQEFAEMARCSETEISHLRIEYESQKSLLLDENKRLSEQLAEMSNNKENSLQHVNTKIQTLESQNKILQNRISNANNSKLESQQEMAQLQKLVSALNKEKAEATQNESKMRKDLDAVNHLLEASEASCKKLEKLLNECELEKSELLEQLDNSNYDAESPCKPLGLVLYDEVMEKVAKNLDGRFNWSYQATNIADLEIRDYCEHFESADLTLFLIGSSDIRGGMKGLEAFGKLKKIVDAVKEMSTVVIAEIAPTCRKGAAGHVSVFNYKLSKMSMADTTVITSNPKTVKDELLNENDNLCEEAVRMIVKKINQELVVPATLKSPTSARPTSESTPSRTINEFLELKPNQVGRVIGQRGTTITSLTRKFEVNIRVGKWGEPKRDDRDNIDMKTDGVIISGKLPNVSNVICEIRKILAKEYTK